MRNMGDMAWLNDYIGIPYVPYGRDFEGVDCYGLVKLIKHDGGYELPDWQEMPPDLKGRADAIASVVCSGTWTPVETPEEGDFVVCYRTTAAHHLGLYFAGGVIHAHEGTGVVFEPLSRFAEKFGRVEYGRWAP